MTWLDAAGLLAAQNNWNGFMLLRLLIFAAVMLLGSILKKVAENREKAMRANLPNKPPAPAPPKKDNPFRNEIEAFLEEVGKRRASGERPGRLPVERAAGEAVMARTAPAQKVEPPRKPITLRPVASGDRDKPEPPKTLVPVLSGRPGDEMAARKAPGSEDLGKQIRTHLSQYLDASRMAAQTQSDLGNAVERNVRQHLGETITVGVAAQEKVATTWSDASEIVPLLRSPSGVRNAVVINEILGPPKGLRRRS